VGNHEASTLSTTDSCKPGAPCLDFQTWETPAHNTLNYTYDAAGHVASIVSSNTNGALMAYTYDTLNRLSTVVDSRLVPQLQLGSAEGARAFTGCGGRSYYFSRRSSAAMIDRAGAAVFAVLTPQFPNPVWWGYTRPTG